MRNGKRFKKTFIINLIKCQLYIQSVYNKIIKLTDRVPKKQLIGVVYRTPKKVPKIS